mmetsp:Transcript_23391/g.65279  ORF Transcript_23391/g.65279 Transcript_23391/m.65279 type:complete len:103 (-) Transcript_23391:1611-1919(-)
MEITDTDVTILKRRFSTQRTITEVSPCAWAPKQMQRSYYYALALMTFANCDTDAQMCVRPPHDIIRDRPANVLTSRIASRPEPSITMAIATTETTWSTCFGE